MKKLLPIMLILQLLALRCFADSLCTQWPNHIFQPTPNPKTHQVAPDYGIYWFKQAGSRLKAMKAFTPPFLAYQLSDGSLNQLPKGETLAIARHNYMQLLEKEGFFDPNKPTLLFIHGDQPTTTFKRKRIDLCYSYLQMNGKMSPPINTLKNWKGWNVGIFYWNQFADDLAGKRIIALIKAVTYPEMKIYSSQNAAHMRWAYINSQGILSFCSLGNPLCAPLPINHRGQPLSIRQILYQSYLNAFPAGYHQDIRISGQSLGTQLAIQLTGYVENNPLAPKPSQLILLDPYFSPPLHHITTDLGNDSTADYNYRIATAFLKKDPKLGFIIYRTSKLSEWPLGDHNKPLQDLSAYLQICPTYLSNAHKKQRTMNEHISCAYIYFYSKHFPTAATSLNANTTLNAIHRLMGASQYCNLTHFSQGCQNNTLQPINCPIENFF